MVLSFDSIVRKASITPQQRTGMTLREETARAQSLGVSLAAYRAMTQSQRQAGAGAVGRLYTARRQDPNAGKIYVPGVGWVTAEEFARMVSEEEPGGFAPPSFSSTEPGLRLQAQLDADAAASQFNFNKQIEEMRQQFEAEQERKKIEAEEKLRREQLLQERQRLFAEMVGNDPVRAVLFGLGLGGSILPGSERFAALPALGEAQSLEMDTERVLAALQGGSVDITSREGKTGVYGLTTPEQLARKFVQGSGADRTVLSSAFGVGGTGTGFTGLNPEELARRIAGVTPKGVLP